jgi:Flp pilus assembly protein TadD
MKLKTIGIAAICGLLAASVAGCSNGNQDIKICAMRPTDVRAAIDACTRLIDSPPLFDPTPYAWFAARGRHKLQAGDSKGALVDLDEAIRLSPKDPQLYETRAEAYQQQGNQKAAERDLGRARRLQRTTTENR